MKVRFLARAAQDLARIAERTRTESPAGAARIGARLKKRADDLTLFPEQGTLSPRTGLREIYVTRTPYILIYRVAANQVQIITIVHAKQRRRS